jgi:hypothetical protein
MPTADVKRYWSLIVKDGCILCGGPAEIAHCHGGSIVERTKQPKAKGKKLPRFDWLVLPLCPLHGREPYPTGLDTNVRAWEAANGTQAHHIDLLVIGTGIDVWALAGVKEIA